MPERTRLKNRAIGLDEWCYVQALPSTGAVAVFAGVVRDNQDGCEVTAIRYHAHAALAEKLLGDIEATAERNYGVKVLVAHAVGHLDVGEVSLLVHVQGGHRGEAFEACRWVVDTIKKSVPIWKEEFFADGRRVFQAGTPIQPV
jgi:molybdopterin synthase catalytic subunit